MNDFNPKNLRALKSIENEESKLLMDPTPSCIHTHERVSIIHNIIYEHLSIDLSLNDRATLLLNSKISHIGTKSNVR